MFAKTSVFDHGWGLPTVAFLFSGVISSAVFWSFVGSIEGVTLMAGLFEAHFAALAFLCQWGANISLLRARKNKGSTRVFFLIAFLIMAGGSAMGVHHVQSTYRDKAWSLEVVARADARKDDEAIIRVSRQSIANATLEITRNTTQGRELGWPAQRIDSYNAGPMMTASNARLDIAEANARLETIGPLLDPHRPWDDTDSFFVAICALAAIIEFFWYWGMQTEALKAGPAVPQKLHHKVVAAVQAQNRRRWGWGAGLLAALGFSLGSQAAAAAPAAVQQAPVSGPSLVAPGAPSLDQQIRDAYKHLKSERMVSAILSREMGRNITRRQVRLALGRPVGPTGALPRKRASGRVRAALENA